MTEPVPLRLHRRTFIRGSALSAAGIMSVAAPTAGLAAGVAPANLERYLSLFQATPVAVDDYQPVALSADEFATLRAAVARIIPADDLGPGAAEAGVQIYIDRSLVGPNAALLPMYQAAMAALNSAAGDKGFAGLAAEDADGLLTQAEASQVADLPDGFFGLLIEHTRQGMFGDPAWGGNVDFIGWDLMGYPGIKLVWTEDDQKINATVAPEHVSVTKFGGPALL